MWWKRKRNTCGYWDCDKRLRDNQFLCEEHHQDWEEGTLDRCPKCGRFKDMQYYLCLDDYYGRRVTRWEPPIAIPAPKQNYRVEFSEAWTDGYLELERVLIYILELADGGFYIDYTTDIRKRYSEHRDAKIPSTAGRNPMLRYVELSANPKAAELRLDELQRLTESNPQQMRLMVRKFRDHLAALEI